jgi:DNA polymerase-3 subunit beta
MPILSNVLVNADEDGRHRHRVRPRHRHRQSEHQAEVMKTGAITVSAKTLLDIVSFAPDAQVTVKKLPNNFAEITSGAAHYKIVGMAPEEFPKLPRRKTPRTWSRSRGPRCSR